MKRGLFADFFIILTIFTTTLLSSCSESSSEYDKVKAERDKYKKEMDEKNMLIEAMRDTISQLSISADQRLAKINNLIKDANYTEAQKQIEAVKKLFPESKEAQQAEKLTKKIEELKEKKKAEEQRIKALGFKGIKQQNSATIDYNKVTFSGISVGRTFVHDSYDDSYFYSTSDRGNVFVSCAMSVTSSSHDPSLPTLAVYSIKGDKMRKEGVMRIEYARWSSYGSYLGNYHDNIKDFSKTSTVRFKLAAEVPQSVCKGPYAIVLIKRNEYSMTYNRYNNPPKAYSGIASYPNTLTLDDFTKKQQPICHYQDCEFIKYEISKLKQNEKNCFYYNRDCFHRTFHHLLYDG